MLLADRLRTFLKYSWILPGIVLLIVAGILLARWQENRQIERKTLEKKREENRQTVEMLGGNRFDILHFYASPGSIRRSEAAELCYGVSNAKTVRLEPQSSAVWPSLSRCVEVAPRKDTTYTLTAEDAAGHTKTATVTLIVR